MIVCFLDGRIGKLPAVSVCVCTYFDCFIVCVFFGRFVVCCKSRTPLQEFNLVIFHHLIGGSHGLHLTMSTRKRYNHLQPLKQRSVKRRLQETQVEHTHVQFPSSAELYSDEDVYL